MKAQLSEYLNDTLASKLYTETPNKLIFPQPTVHSSATTFSYIANIQLKINP